MTINKQANRLDKKDAFGEGMPYKKMTKPHSCISDKRNEESKKNNE